MYSQIQDIPERTFGLSKAGGAFPFSFVNPRHDGIRCTIHNQTVDVLV